VAGCGGSGIHLGGATAGGLQQAVAEAQGLLRAGVVAAAIHEDQLMSGCPIGLQRPQGASKGWPLVKDGHDDGNGCHAGSGRFG